MKNISIRLTAEEFDQMETLAKRYRVSQANIIRWAIDALGEYVERNNGRITLPLDFEDIPKRHPAAILNEPAPDYSPQRSPEPASNPGR